MTHLIPLIASLLAYPAHADGLSIHMEAEAKFIYTQVLNGMGENLTVQVDVTAKVPYEIQGNMLVIL